jgi:hypothetical protein
MTAVTGQTAEFAFRLHGYETNDAVTGDYLDLEATIACRGFAGRTAFPLARRDLDSFIVDLAAVRDGSSDAALLLGGWDHAEQRLRLRITPVGRSGQFIARVRIANVGPRGEWQYVETEFVCPPDTISGFLTDLGQLVTAQQPGDARLIGDPDAID